MTAQEEPKKVVILDSLQAKEIIKQLVQGDAAKAQNKIFHRTDSISQVRIKNLKSMNKDLTFAYKEKSLESTDCYKSNADKDKIIVRKNNLNNILIGFSGAALLKMILELIF